MIVIQNSVIRHKEPPWRVVKPGTVTVQGNTVVFDEFEITLEISDLNATGLFLCNYVIKRMESEKAKIEG